MANIKKTQSDYVPSIIDIKETLQDLCDYYSTNLVVSKGAERKSYKKKLENIKIILILERSLINIYQISN